MVDASNEFQVFLSPLRDYQKPYRDKSKHRVVPVINKLSTSSSSSSLSSATFTLNHRKPHIYKAVSGVSFQDTDRVSNRDRSSRREQQENEAEALKRYASLLVDSEKKRKGPVLGARRSRSLTSMEFEGNNSICSSNRLVEITHPCTPVIMSKHGSTSGSNSRHSRHSGKYSKAHERRRSSSHARDRSLEKKISGSENVSQNTDQTAPPIRPRRARSASRTRHHKGPPSSESNVESASNFYVDNYYLRQEQLLKMKNKEDANNSANNSANNPRVHVYRDQIPLSVAPEIDFSVSDTDWQKYDTLVSKKLKMLKKTEEPEGGYFSLEREEAEELDRSSEDEIYFQKDKSNETIYVMQVFQHKRAEDVTYKNTVVKENYSEVLYKMEPQEVSFIDDEGLYEEIFVERASITPKNPMYAPHKDDDGPTINANIKISKENNLESPHPHQSTKIEKTPVSTIVYIGGCDEDNIESHFSQLRSKASIPSQPPVRSERKKTRKTDSENAPSVVQITPYLENERQISSSSSWFGFSSGHERLSRSVNSDSPRIHREFSVSPSKNSIEVDHPSKPSSTNGQSQMQRNCSADMKENTVVNNTEISRASSHVEITSSNKNIPCLRSQTSNVALSQSRSDQESRRQSRSEQEPQSQSRSEQETRRQSQENVLKVSPPGGISRTSKEINLHKQIGNSIFYANEKPLEKTPRRKKATATKPSVEPKNIATALDFQEFLRNSLFNPETESLTDDMEELVINEDQVVTCISDTSSSDDDSDKESENEVSSPWLEAKSEFEYVIFKDEVPNPPNVMMRKKKLKKVDIPKLFSSSIMRHSPNSACGQPSTKFQNHNMSSYCSNW